MTNDPRLSKGSIVSGGDPYAENGAIIDATHAVLMDGVSVAMTRPYHNVPLDVIAMSLEGRINQTQERSNVVYLFSPEAAAAIIADLYGLMHRAGRGQEMDTLLTEAMGRLP